MCQFCIPNTPSPDMNYIRFRDGTIMQNDWGERAFCIKCGTFDMIHYDTRKCEACTQWAQILSHK